MFVFSIRSGALKRAVCVGLCLAAAVAAVAFLGLAGSRSAPVSRTAQKAQLSVSGAQDVGRYLASFGWETAPEPLEIREVRLPEEFDDVYQNYNAIQRGQGFDLTPYAGKRVKRWTFTITNYPGEPADGVIRANVLVWRGKIIGGDVCSVRLDGFMHGFAREEGRP